MSISKVITDIENIDKYDTNKFCKKYQELLGELLAEKNDPKLFKKYVDKKGTNNDLIFAFATKAAIENKYELLSELCKYTLIPKTLSIIFCHGDEPSCNIGYTTQSSIYYYTGIFYGQKRNRINPNIC